MEFFLINVSLVDETFSVIFSQWSLVYLTYKLQILIQPANKISSYIFLFVGQN